MSSSNINYNSLYADLLKDEGVRSYVYDDATGKPLVPGMRLVGHPTVGIGRNLEQRGLTQQEIKILFLNDIELVLGQLQHYYGDRFFDRLSERRKNILIGMAFNMGIKRFSKFEKMIAALERENYDKAADEILDSKAARDLPSRYERYAERMRNDI